MESLKKALPYIIITIAVVAIVLAIRNSQQIKNIRYAQGHSVDPLPKTKPIQDPEEIFPHPNKMKHEQSASDTPST